MHPFALWGSNWWTMCLYTVYTVYKIAFILWNVTPPFIYSLQSLLQLWGDCPMAASNDVLTLALETTCISHHHHHPHTQTHIVHENQTVDRHQPSFIITAVE